jgi:hypothetical protein
MEDPKVDFDPKNDCQSYGSIFRLATLWKKKHDEVKAELDKITKERFPITLDPRDVSKSVRLRGGFTGMITSYNWHGWYEIRFRDENTHQMDRCVDKYGRIDNVYGLKDAYDIVEVL